MKNFVDNKLINRLLAKDIYIRGINCRSFILGSLFQSMNVQFSYVDANDKYVGMKLWGNECVSPSTVSEIEDSFVFVTVEGENSLNQILAELDSKKIGHYVLSSDESVSLLEYIPDEMFYKNLVELALLIKDKRSF